MSYLNNCYGLSNKEDCKQALKKDSLVIAALHQQKSLAQLVSDLKMLPQELINLRLRQGFDALSDDVVKQEVKAVEDILGAHGRVLLRKSGTEPVVRVMVEGEVRSEVHDLAVRLADTIRRQAEEG